MFVTENYNGAITGVRRAKLDTFLAAQDIEYDDGIQYGVIVYDEHGDIAATGGAENNVLKSIAVHSKYRGEGLLATVVSALVSQAFLRGFSHLFLFTKPDNEKLFIPLGFYKIESTDAMCLMENEKDGIKNFIDGLSNQNPSMPSCAIVANCNPFTLGHLHLVETAARSAEILHLFVLSEKLNLFPQDVRYELVKRGVAHIKNVVVHPTSDYIVSSVTFPTYFLKDKANILNVSCELDLKIFCRYFVPKFNIKTRFVGSEPSSEITALYNRQMKEYLPKYGVSVVEIPRKTVDDTEISASRVRTLLRTGDFIAIRQLVPDTTYEYLIGHECKKLLEKGNICPK